MKEEENKKTMCATWKEILCTLWQQMMEDSMKSMENSDLIAEIWKIWHVRDKYIHQEVNLELEAAIRIGEIIPEWRGRQLSWELLNH